VNSFPKSCRLLAKPQFDRVFEKAKRVFFPEFIVLFRPNEKENACLGLAISKKSVKKAIDRNRCKRLVRESFRLSTLPNVDMIFLSRKGLDKLSNTQLSEKLAFAWKKLEKSHLKH
jgi:ribonuclease P protein component